MYSYIKGSISQISSSQIIVENNGIGYEIEISTRAYEFFKNSEEVTVYTQIIVREDSQTLFGFQNSTEKAMFNKLISVSGIGPNTGRLILSGMQPNDIFSAVQTENDLAFKTVKGVGPKTAKRIILDLKGKLNELQLTGKSSTSSAESAGLGNTVYDEALSALCNLGFKKPQVNLVLKKLEIEQGQNVKLEDLVRIALKGLTGG